MGALIRRVVPPRLRPIGYLTNLVRKRTEDRVRLGPFTGMRYIDQAIGSAYLPKLLGTYERELANVIELVCASRPRLIVDVGSAEGYYAVGLAKRNPQARVVAFEREATGREALRTMAQLNRVQDQIQVLGNCEPTELQAALCAGNDGYLGASPQRPFLLCDVEGDEGRLLDPAAVPGLRRASILVETHEFVFPGITNRLRRRFAATHSVNCIWQTDRARADFPFRGAATWLLPKSYLDWAVSEWRPSRMCWLWMRLRE
jgi:hypothetical protein